jgi:hypothetical protein
MLAHLNERCFCQDARQQHEGRGQVSRHEMIVEQTPALNAALPRDVQKLVTELRNPLKTQIVVQQQQGHDQQRRRRGFGTQFYERQRDLLRVPQMGPPAMHTDGFPNEESESKAQGRARGKAES